ncbi:hypothetical protein ACTFIR_003942 [Dictyostelium discoideum]
MLNQLLLLKNQTDIVNDPFITRIMTGIHKLRPSSAKYQEIWDANQELTSLDDTNSQVCPVRHLSTYLRASKGRRKPHSGDSDFIQNEGKPLDVKEINIIVLSTLSSSGIDGVDPTLKTIMDNGAASNEWLQLLQPTHNESEEQRQD